MSAPTTSIYLNKTTPAAPTGEQNVVFQSDNGAPDQQVTAYDPVMVGDSGSGGLAGNVPAPPAGSAAAKEFLRADGSWVTPSGNVYDIAFYLSGTFTASQIIMELNVVRVFTLPASLTGSVAALDTAPTNAMSFSILHNGSSAGSINFAAGSKSGTFTFSAAITFAVGDTLSVVAPSTADATGAGLSTTFMGSR